MSHQAHTGCTPRVWTWVLALSMKTLLESLHVLVRPQRQRWACGMSRDRMCYSWIHVSNLLWSLTMAYNLACHEWYTILHVTDCGGRESNPWKTVTDRKLSYRQWLEPYISHPVVSWITLWIYIVSRYGHTAEAGRLSIHSSNCSSWPSTPK